VLPVDHYPFPEERRIASLILGDHVGIHTPDMYAVTA
jgi:hypothetical protein